jgi:hypothetical protein
MEKIFLRSVRNPVTEIVSPISGKNHIAHAPIKVRPTMREGESGLTSSKPNCAGIMNGISNIPHSNTMMIEVIPKRECFRVDSFAAPEALSCVTLASVSNYNTSTFVSLWFTRCLALSKLFFPSFQSFRILHDRVLRQCVPTSQARRNVCRIRVAFPAVGGCNSGAIAVTRCKSRTRPRRIHP